MNLLERVLTLLHANLNSVVEKAEDPEHVLKQLQLDMRNQLVQVKTQVATAIAESNKLQKRSKERLAEAELWMKKVEQAIQHGNDDTARAALTRYNDFMKQAKRYQQQQKEQEQLVITMRSALRQLEAKIAEVETTIELLVARKRSALLQQRVFDALNMNGNPKDKERTAKAQDAVVEAEARARALADLHKRDFDTQLDQISEEQRVEQQLRDLKKKAGIVRETPLLPPGGEQPSPILHPKPQSGEPARKHATPEQAGTDIDADIISAKDREIEHLKKLLEARQFQPGE